MECLLSMTNVDNEHMSVWKTKEGKYIEAHAYYPAEAVLVPIDNYEEEKKQYIESLELNLQDMLEEYDRYDIHESSVEFSSTSHYDNSFINITRRFDEDLYKCAYILCDAKLHPEKYESNTAIVVNNRWSVEIDDKREPKFVVL